MINFKNIPDDDKPRERLYKYGSDNLSDEELLSIILKTGTKGMSVKEVALKLLEELGDIKRLKDIGINTLMGISGIGRVKAIELKAAIELGRRIYMENNKIEGVVFNNSLKIYEYFKEIVGDKKQEYFYRLNIHHNHKNYINA